MTPKRIQRKRTKGWRMPDDAVYVGRPTVWGNPFRDAEWYRAWLTGKRFHAGIPMPFAALPPKPDLEPLRGHDIVCWCPLDQPCHADVLLELANA